MTHKISNRAGHAKAILNKALKDGKVTEKEAKAIVKDVKQKGVTGGEKRALRNGLLGNVDKFEPAAQQRVAKLTGGLQNKFLGDPAAMNNDKDARYGVAYGKLFRGGVSADDIRQGGAGDCYFLASLASVAKTNPQAIQNMIKPNKDGTVTVRFWDRSSGTPQPVDITIDRDLPKSYGANLYTQSPKAELWPALIEKAFAKWKGSYEAIGEGGFGADAIAAITGQPTQSLGFNGRSPDEVFNWLAARQAEGRPVTSATQANPDGNEVSGGIVNYHLYSVLGVSEQNGVKLVTLRNPWGNTEPGNDGRDDGVFSIPLDQYLARFAQADSTA